MINWQLSKQGIRWPVSLDRIAGSGVDPSRSTIFWKLSADEVLVFKWLQAQVWFFKFIYFTSDVMYKLYKRLVYTHPDLLARFCKINLSNAKNSAGIFFPGLINLRWSRAIMALNKCDRRWLPVFGCTYEAINSMWDLVHSWAVCKLFFVKSLSLSLKSHTNVL